MTHSSVGRTSCWCGNGNDPCRGLPPPASPAGPRMSRTRFPHGSTARHHDRPRLSPRHPPNASSPCSGAAPRFAPAVPRPDRPGPLTAPSHPPQHCHAASLRVMAESCQWDTLQHWVAAFRSRLSRVRSTRPRHPPGSHTALHRTTPPRPMRTARPRVAVAGEGPGTGVGAGACSAAGRARAVPVSLGPTCVVARRGPRSDGHMS